MIFARIELIIDYSLILYFCKYFLNKIELNCQNRVFIMNYWLSRSNFIANSQSWVDMQRTRKSQKEEV